ITEQLVLFEVESTHRLGLASAEEDGRHFARATRALAFFNGLLIRLLDRFRAFWISSQRCTVDTVPRLLRMALRRAFQGDCEAFLGSESSLAPAAIAKGLQEAAAFDPFTYQGV
ncbi:hypothetical protein, partial [Stutzerimonas kunmingensis]|uniref:hypothetical protein n=1 Tax=Stutzerimonas kunmingensis TaxID=1211807 RepID=UPI001CD0BAD3